MGLRSSWEGFLKLSLISVPVRAYNATVPGKGEIHFNQIHKGCGSRIRYQKVCPVHGEVTNDEIVSGYEYEKNAYLELDRQEVADLRAENDQSITIDGFTTADTIDPILLSGRSFYLVPDGPAGQKPYALLQRVMKDKKRCAVATVIISGHEETVLLRSLDKMLAMTVLYYETQIKKTSDFTDEIGAAAISAQELKLAETLVDASTSKKISLAGYKDHFMERTREIIEAKLAGKKPHASRSHSERPVINLMDALRKSVAQVHDPDKKPKSRPRTPRQVNGHSRRKTG